MPVTHKQVIEKFIANRDKIKDGEEKTKVWKAGINEQQEKLIEYFIREMTAKEVRTFNTEAGTAFDDYKEFVNIDDRVLFTNFILNMMLMTVYPNRYRDADTGEYHEHGEEMLERDKNAILDAGALDFITLSANKVNCIQYMNEHDGVLPQGLKYTKERTVKFRRPTTRKSK